MSNTYLVRDAMSTGHRESVDLALEARAVRCVALPGFPGYLTGEAPEVQGIESTLPNLPDLDLPEMEVRRYLLQISFVSVDTVRLTIAPTGAGVLGDDGTGLGIVVDSCPGEVEVTVSESEDAMWVATDQVGLRIGLAPFSLVLTDRVRDVIVLRTAERLRQAAGLPMAPAVLAADNRMTLHVELEADEEILGFGEQFSRLVKNGQRLTLSCEDALGTGTGMAYKPVPVWSSSAGYTGFLNTGAKVVADVGHSRPSVLGLEVDDEAVDLYVVVGGSPKRRLESYTGLTGRAQVPPLWAFGYWMGRCRYHSAGEMIEVADRMRALKVPCDVLHLDPDWLVVDRLNCDFVWNTQRFGRRHEFVEELARRGLRLSIWELPYLDPISPRYAEAEREGYLVAGPDGAPAHVVNTPTPDGRPRALVDFSNPDARAWWQDLHQEFLDDGVAVLKTDFGEGLPPDARLADGTPPNHAHNLYPLQYNGAVSEAIARFTKRAPLVWGRSGWAGSHRYPGQWGGDAESTVAGMQATLRGGLSYALSAPGLWSHDIGGFFGPELTPELYIRWTQLGALSPLMRAHGLRPREPWAFGDHALEVVRRWVRLRYELLPYIWQVVHESLRMGWPVLRPMVLEFPQIPESGGMDSQFMLGSNLLVVPVLDDRRGPSPRRFFVPPGRWTDLFTSEELTGPCFVERAVPIDRVPVLVRSGATIPRVDVDDSVRNTDDLVGRPWTLHVYGAHGPETDLVGFDGTVTTVRAKGETVIAEGTQPIDPDFLRHA